MKLDWKKFLPSLFIILIILILVTANLEKVQTSITEVYDFLIDKCNWFIILSNITAMIFSLYMMFGPYRNVRLGGPDAKPAFKTLPWAAMMFCTSCGAWLIVYGFLEPIYCAAQTALPAETNTAQAFEYGQMYAHYHWGPNAWCIYVPASIAIGYILYRGGKEEGSVGEACSPILKGRQGNFFKWLIDILSILGAIISPVISIGTGMPLLTILLQDLFNIPDSSIPMLQIAILGIWVLIFSVSVYLGLKRGIKNLSNINIGLALLLMLAVGVMTGIFKVFSAEISTAGLIADNYFRLLTYTDAFGSGSFVKGWTVSYWTTYFVYMPLMGVFNAKISKGRTFKEIAFGQLVLCTLGCWVSMGTFGNYAMKLQVEGIVDVAGILNSQGEAAAILAILKSMPCSKIMIFAVLAICFIFLATTMDSSAFTAAEMTVKHTGSEELAPRWVRVVWAVIACAVAFTLLRVGGFLAVRTVSVITGIPLAIIMYLMILSLMKLLKEDKIIETKDLKNKIEKSE